MHMFLSYIYFSSVTNGQQNANGTLVIPFTSRMCNKTVSLVEFFFSSWRLPLPPYNNNNCSCLSKAFIITAYFLIFELGAHAALTADIWMDR